MNLLDQLSKKAFWDVDMKTMDAEKHANYIIQNVFEYGTLDDMLNVHRYYNSKKIKEAFVNYQFFLPDSAAFAATIYDIEKEDLKCFSPKRLRRNVTR
ncbi:MAG: hypothetical protein JWR72_1655 [Flavisolibacter sp.]|jgi:hypothetical protein|nr:hypothetical protein [Flavisolibacter sp.]